MGKKSVFIGAMLVLVLLVAKIFSNSIEYRNNYVSLNLEENRVDTKNTFLADGIDDMLIIVTSEMLFAAKTLANWCRRKGYGVKIVSQDSWTTKEAVAVTKEFYNLINSKKPKYVTILGDHFHIPMGNISGVYTDKVFGDVVDDFVDEMAVGRIPSATTDIANNTVRKLINYEVNPSTNKPYYKRVISALNEAMFLGGFGDPAKAKGAIARYSSNGYTILDYSNSATNNQIVDEIDKGAVFLSYLGHGGSFGFTSPPKLHTTHIRTLENGNRLPFVFSVTCCTGMLQDKNNMATVFLSQKNGGAVGFYGATIPTSLTGNCFVLDRTTKALFPQNGSLKTTTSGDIIRRVETPYFDKAYNYAGSPVTYVWLEEPKNIVANYNSLSSSQQKFDISGLSLSCDEYIEEAVATLYNLTQDTIMAYSTIMGTSVSLPITANLYKADKVILTISGPGYKPLIDTLYVDNDSTGIIKNFITIFTPNSGDLKKEFTYSIHFGAKLDDSVNVELLKGDNSVYTIASNVKIINGSKSVNWTIPDSIELGNDYKIKVSKVGNDSIYDKSDDFFTISKASGLTKFPYIQTFDKFKNGTELSELWVQASGDGFDWSVLSGSTPTNIDGGETYWPNTGPSKDHTSGSGKYLYTEANKHHNKSATIFSPIFDTRNTDILKLSFYYHMWAEGKPDGKEGMGILKCYYKVDQDAWKSLFKKSGNQGESWNGFSVVLDSSIGYKKGFVQFKFVGTMRNYDVSDIAIDDFKIEETGIVSTLTTNLAKIAASDFKLNSNSINLQLSNSNKKQVTVLLYDLRGRKISVLVDEVLGYGSYQISLGNIMNNISSGVYICRMQIGRKSIVRSVIVR